MALHYKTEYASEESVMAQNVPSSRLLALTEEILSMSGDPGFLVSASHGGSALPICYGNNLFLEFMGLNSRALTSMDLFDIFAYQGNVKIFTPEKIKAFSGVQHMRLGFTDSYGGEGFSEYEISPITDPVTGAAYLLFIMRIEPHMFEGLKRIYSANDESAYEATNGIALFDQEGRFQRCNALFVRYMRTLLAVSAPGTHLPATMEDFMKLLEGVSTRWHKGGWLCQIAGDNMNPDQKIFVSVAVRENQKIVIGIGDPDLFDSRFSSFTDAQILPLNLKGAEAELKAPEEITRRPEDHLMQTLRTLRHDMGAPLNAVVGFAELLKMSDNLSEKERQYVDFIMEGAVTALTSLSQTMDEIAS